MRTSFSLSVIGCLFWSCAVSATEPTPAQRDFFERSVRPVLVDHCLSCHGPKKQQAGLRLDSRAAMLKGGDSGPTVKPGDATASLLIQAVRHKGDVKKMPPKKALAPEAIEALAAWVNLGAPWPVDTTTTNDADAWKKHWAFQAVRNPPLPAVKAESWPANPLDRFILARLEAKRLAPSIAADKRTLLRRVTFDLIGLPPTPEELAAFEADSSPDAFTHVVERLLASPHYGERWGRYWLDVARYADNKGYVFFEEGEYPWAYTYRDYVIRAFNEDLPYDEFIRQQLAADLLPLGDDKRPLTALGFLTLGGHFMSNPHDIIDDRIDVVMRGLQGLTVTCARCHDHKFDPIPTKDYYALYGVFASSMEPTVQPLFAPPPQTEAYHAFEKEMQSRERKLADFLNGKFAELVRGASTRMAEYLLAANKLSHQPDIEDFMLIADGGDLNPKMLHRWRVYLERTRKKYHPVWAPWHTLAALPEKEFAARATELIAQWQQPNAEMPINALVARVLAEKPPRTLTEAAQRYAELVNTNESLAQTGQGLDAPRQELREVVRGADAPANVAMSTFSELELLPDRPAQGRLQELRKAVEQWRASGPGAPPRANTLVDAAQPYQPHVFLRGNPTNLGAAVPRQFVGFLAGPQRQPFTNGSGRRELAEAIASRSNPLTARVLVNRVWMHHFGSPLVGTPGDFGLRSEPPTHPELLDWLATWFMDNGWSVKKLHRLLLSSHTYQQASADRPEARKVDPENALLWRVNRRRLDFEAMRDGLLAVSGGLDRSIGGPPVRDIASAGATRRTLYGYIDRLNMPGLYRTFDFPSPDATSPRRDSTTVAPQALFLMNHPFVLTAARRLLARPEVARDKDTMAKVEHLYRLLFVRPPTVQETTLAREYLSEKATAAEWERYVQALLLTNEFVFVD
jgi:hypothetical protein